jgi:hypothetical protein
MPRPQKKFHFLYKTTNIVTGCYYYGVHSTDNLDDGYLGSGRRLRYSIRKYGEEKHNRQILEFFNDRQALLSREAEVVDLNEISKNDCMNLCVGGIGGWYANGRQLTLEERRRIGALGNKAFASMLKDEKYRKRFVDKVKKGLGPVHNWTGRSHTDETKEKMRKSHKGKHQGASNSQFGTCWITKDGVNKKIPKGDIDSWLESGWSKGRKLKHNVR